MIRNTRINKITMILYIASIFMITTIPLLGLRNSGGKLENENRYKSNIPKFLNGNKINTNLPKDAEAWINDNILYRGSFIKLNSLINIKLFGTSPNEEKVLIGKNNWLFYSGERSVEFYRNSRLYNKDELLRIKQNLLKQKEYLDKRNCKMILMISPNKETIYSEYYPENISKVSSYSKLDQIIDYLHNNTDIEIVDVRNELKSAKSNDILYYLTDTHWNNMGGYIGYQKLMKSINKVYGPVPSLNKDDFVIKTVNKKSGDMQNMLALNGYFDDLDYKFTPKKPYLYKEVKTSDKSEQVTIIEKSNLPKCVMQRDSFTVAVKPFLSNSFSKITYKWNHKFDYELIEREKPDIYIHNMVERYMDVLADTKAN